MAINPLFDATYYLNQNPDVRAAVGLDSEAAWDHYQNFGASEGRMPNSWFDAGFYADEYPDLMDAGLKMSDLLDHFYEYGAAEGRAPNGDINEESWFGYAMAEGNADLREAFGIDEDADELTDDQIKDLSDHFFHWGIGEGRDGAPITTTGGQNFNLTRAIDNLTGTSGDDVFNAYEIDPETGQAADTLNNHDKIDGGAGNDTLNIFVGDNDENSELKANAEIRNIETINIYNNANAEDAFRTGGDGIDAGRFEGAELINQVNAAAGVNNLGEGVTAGFEKIDELQVEVTASDDAASADILLNQVGGARLDISGDALSDVTIEGSLTDENGSVYLALTAGEEVETLTLDTEVNAFVTTLKGKALKEFDSTASDSDIRVVVSNHEDTPELDTIYTGAGDDFVGVVELGDGVETLTIDTGEGEDLIVLGSAVLNSNVVLDVNAGDDDDIVFIAGSTFTVDQDNSVIDGGDGHDIVSVQGGDDFGRNEQKFVQNVLQNFEEIHFRKEVGKNYVLRGDWLTDFETIVLHGGGKINNVSSDQAIITAGDLTASGSDNLDVTARGEGAKELNLTADSADISIEGAEVELKGELSSANIDLVDEDEEGNSLASSIEVKVGDNDVTGLETLVITGNGEAKVINAAADEDEEGLTLVDASGMTDGSLDYTAAKGLAETIILGDGVDTIRIGEDASNYMDDEGNHTFDSIVNFNFLFDEDDGAFAGGSDKLIIDNLDANFDFYTEYDASNETDFDQALLNAWEASGSQDGAGVIFEYEGNTYIFVDDGAESTGVVDADDTLVELTGTVGLDLDALADALVAAANA